MYKNNRIIVGKNEEKEMSILLDKANRHGLITGASVIVKSFILFISKKTIFF